MSIVKLKSSNTHVRPQGKEISPRDDRCLRKLGDCPLLKTSLKSIAITSLTIPSTCTGCIQVGKWAEYRLSKQEIFQLIK